MSTVAYPHLELRPNGTLYFACTPFKVRQIVLDHVAYGWDAAEIPREHPQLKLGQIHVALGYYYDHQEELDREIEEGRELANELRAKQGENSDSPDSSPENGEGLRKVYEILSERYASGHTDTAARHNEPQP